MPFIDDRGRLFGRLNIVDAAVLLVVALLIPMAYGAYLIFQPLPARIVALEPARIQEGTAEVKLRGEHLRPYLRVVIGTQAATFLFADSSGGVLQLPALMPGVYDVVLLDEEAELARARGALVVDAKGSAAPPPPRSIMVDVVMRSSLWPEELTLLNSWNHEEGSDGISLISADVVGKAPSGQLFTTWRMRVPVVETEQGWVHGGEVIWRGQTFTFERPSYRLVGRVVAIEPVPTTPTPAQ